MAYVKNEIELRVLQAAYGKARLAKAMLPKRAGRCFVHLSMPRPMGRLRGTVQHEVSWELIAGKPLSELADFMYEQMRSAE